MYISAKLVIDSCVYVGANKSIRTWMGRVNILEGFWCPLRGGGEYWRVVNREENTIEGNTKRGALLGVWCFLKKKKQNKNGNFPGGQLARTSPSNAGGLTPGQGAAVPHASRQKQNKEAKQKASNIVKSSINTLKVDIKKIFGR